MFILYSYWFLLGEACNAAVVCAEVTENANQISWQEREIYQIVRFASQSNRKPSPDLKTTEILKISEELYYMSNK